jgi:hypothetical protein
MGAYDFDRDIEVTAGIFGSNHVRGPGSTTSGHLGVLVHEAVELTTVRRHVSNTWIAPARTPNSADVALELHWKTIGRQCHQDHRRTRTS